MSGSSLILFTSLGLMSSIGASLHAPRQRSAHVDWADKWDCTCESRRWPWLNSYLTSTDVATHKKVSNQIGIRLKWFTRDGQIVNSHMRKLRVCCTMIIPPLNGVLDMFDISSKVLYEFWLGIPGLGWSKGWKVVEHVARLDRLLAHDSHSVQIITFLVAWGSGMTSTTSVSSVLATCFMYVFVNSIVTKSLAVSIQSSSQCAVLKYWSLYWGWRTEVQHQFHIDMVSFFGWPTYGNSIAFRVVSEWVIMIQSFLYQGDSRSNGWQVLVIVWTGSEDLVDVIHCQDHHCKIQHWPWKIQCHFLQYLCALWIVSAVD